MKRSRLVVVALLAIVFPSLSQAADAKPLRPGADIIGGAPVSEPNPYRFMAAILDESYGSNDYQKQYCGGSLIAPTWVLTAAHCVEGHAVGNLRVAIGRTYLNTSPPQGKIAVRNAFVHEDFNEGTLENDAALLELAEASSFQPIQLAATTPAHDLLENPPTLLTVIGWGTTSTRKLNYPNQLHEVDVPAVSDGTCQSSYGASLDAATMTCAGAPNIDSCYGDSGGPLFYKNGGSPIQVGVVSWGKGCAKRKFPGVYSEVNSESIRSWISRTTRNAV